MNIKEIKKRLIMAFATISLPILGYFVYNKDRSLGVDVLLEKEPGQIIFMGDQGSGSDTQYLVAEKINKEHKNSLIVTLGDNFYPIGLQSGEQFFTQMFDVYTKHKIAVVGGNHDIYADIHRVVNPRAKYESSHKMLLGFAKRFDRIVYPGKFFTLITPLGTCVLVFDSTVYSVLIKTKFVKRQNEYIDQFISRDDCDKKIVAAHHSFRSPGKHGHAGGKLKAIYEKLSKEVDLIIGGHDHLLSYMGRVNNARLYVSGSAGKIRKCVGRVPEGGWCEARSGYLVYKNGEMKPVFVGSEK